MRRHDKTTGKTQRPKTLKRRNAPKVCDLRGFTGFSESSDPEDGEESSRGPAPPWSVLCGQKTWFMSQTPAWRGTQVSGKRSTRRTPRRRAHCYGAEFLSPPMASPIGAPRLAANDESGGLGPNLSPAPINPLANVTLSRVCRPTIFRGEGTQDCLARLFPRISV